MIVDWYQTIPELGIKGKINTPEEFDKIGLPKDMHNWSVLDIGCNTGAYLMECAKRGAFRTDGVEANLEWRILANGIFQELNHKIVVFNTLNFSSLYDLVLLLSVTHVVEGMSGQEILDKAWERVRPGGLLILEINDRLQKEDIKLPKEAVFYGKAKDNRSVYHCVKSNI